MHFELVRFIGLFLVVGFVAVLFGLFQSFSKDGPRRTKLDDLDERVSKLENPGGK
jgi:hypothetical protein